MEYMQLRGQPPGVYTTD